jgi:hypothetical protein
VKATGYHFNQAGRKTVWVEEIIVGTEDHEIKDFAMAYAGETPGSLQDRQLKRDPHDVSKAVVHLLTD